MRRLYIDVAHKSLWDTCPKAKPGKVHTKIVLTMESCTNNF